MKVLSALIAIFLAAVPALWAQPGQPAPAQPSISMQDSNLRPALQGIGIDQLAGASK